MILEHVLFGHSLSFR